jgi:hypothetical protein
MVTPDAESRDTGFITTNSFNLWGYEGAAVPPQISEFYRMYVCGVFIPHVSNLVQSWFILISSNSWFTNVDW